MIFLSNKTSIVATMWCYLLYIGKLMIKVVLICFFLGNTNIPGIHCKDKTSNTQFLCNWFIIEMYAV